MPDNNKIKNARSGEPGLLSRMHTRSSADDHHMELIDEVNGITFINDSMAIRLTATRNSLEAVKAPVVLIVGGDDSENDYSLLFRQVKEKVTAIIYLGSDSDRILKHYSRHYMLFAKAAGISEAVQIANACAKPGDAVLFSPGCPGCYPFDNYRNRGNEFKTVVKKLSA